MICFHKKKTKFFRKQIPILFEVLSFSLVQIIILGDNQIGDEVELHKL